MSLLQVLILGGVVWVALAVGVALLVGATIKDPELYADDEDWCCWPHRIDQRRD